MAKITEEGQALLLALLWNRHGSITWEEVATLMDILPDLLNKAHQVTLTPTDDQRDGAAIAISLGKREEAKAVTLTYPPGARELTPAQPMPLGMKSVTDERGRRHE